jgi:Ser/Thr protein kinase RdoA (MazF antagonist)
VTFAAEVQRSKITRVLDFADGGHGRRIQDIA